MKTPFILWMNIFPSRKVKDKYTFVVPPPHIKITCFPYPQLPTCIINQFVFTTSPECTIKRLSWYVIILLCQIIYEALETQIWLIKCCDYLSMSNNLYGARETNIVLIDLYTL